MPAKPKPERTPKKPRKPIPSRSRRKQKPKTKSICVECGEIWRGADSAHMPDCAQSLDVIRFNKPKTDKQMYEAALDNICRLITTWRDGCKCVIHNDGCGQVSQWSHVIPQGRSAYLVYCLSNSFRQSETCNLLHRSVNAPYYDWYRSTFGERAYKMLIKTWQTKKGGRKDLPQLLIQYVDLYKNRHKYSVMYMEDLVRDGYFGEIIRDAWVKEGRI